jgi:ATP-dependent Clp protease ATP-binding subunit ClpA
VAPIPYVQRDIEGEVSDHLRSGRPVLLVGSSMVGKTRMAVRLVRDMFPDRGVVIPDSMDALASLDAADVALRELVIFLDDINRLIGSGGITDGALRQLIAAGNIVIGTIRAAEYDQYQPTDQFRPAEWDVVSVFERVVVIRELSPVEEDRLISAVGDRELR